MCEKSADRGNSHGTAVFHYSYRYYSGTGSTESAGFYRGGILFCLLQGGAAGDTAQNRGINDLDRIRKGVKAANIMSGVYAVLVYGLVYIALPYIVPLFISEQVEMVCGYARTYITICGMFFIPLGMIFIFRNALQGCGFGFMPMMGGVVELLSRGIVAFAAAHLMSYVGVCFANASAWLTAGIFLWIAYHFLMKKMVRDKKGHEERMLAEAMQ